MGNLLNRLDLRGRMVERKSPHLISAQSFFTLRACLSARPLPETRGNYQAQIKSFYVRPFCIQDHGSICENNVQ